MGGIVTIRPNETLAAPPEAVTVGAASRHAALADDSDTSYVRHDASFDVLYGFGTSALAAGRRWKQARIRVRIGITSGGGSDTWIHFRSIEGVYGYPDYWDIYSSLGTLVGAWKTIEPTGQAWDQTYVDNLQVRIHSASATTPHYYALYVDLEWDAQPTVAVTAPTGTSTITKPTVAWTFADAENLDQSRYEVALFTSAQYGVAGFDPSTSPALYRSGEKLGGIKSFEIPLGIGNGTYRAYVRAAHEMPAGAPYYSPWSYSQFVVDVDAPHAPAVVTTPEPEDSRVRLDINLEDDYFTESLLSANQSTAEADPLGWFEAGGSAGGDVSRWNVSPYQGSYSMIFESGGIGNPPPGTVIGRTDPGTVEAVPGAMHKIRFWYRPDGPVDMQVSLRWMNSGGGLISTSNAPLLTAAAQDPDYVWRVYEHSLGPAPSNATHVEVQITLGDAATPAIFYQLDEIYLTAALDSNLLTNPGFNENTTGWVLGGNTRRVEGEPGEEGQGSIILGKSGSGYTEALRYSSLPALPATIYTISHYLKPSLSLAGTWWLRVEAYNASNVLLGRLNADGSWVNGAETSRVLLPTSDLGSWGRQVITTQATPANTSYLRFIYAEDTAITSGDYGHIDAIQVEPGAGVTAYRDAQGTYLGNNPAYDLAFVVQYSDDNWENVYTFLGSPFEAAEHTVVLYDYTVNGTREYRAVATATDVNDVEFEGFHGPPVEATLLATDIWLKAVDDYTLNMKVFLIENPQKVEEDTAVFRPRGRNRPVVLHGAKYGKDGSLVVIARNKAEYDQVIKLFEHQGTLLLQGPDGQNDLIRMIGTRSIEHIGYGQAYQLSAEYVMVAP